MGRDVLILLLWSAEINIVNILMLLRVERDVLLLWSGERCVILIIEPCVVILLYKLWDIVESVTLHFIIILFISGVYFVVVE